LISAGQIRAARALLRWSQADLAKAADVSVPTLKRWEATDDVPSGTVNNLKAVQRALEAAGIEFIDENGGGPGVRLKRR